MTGASTYGHNPAIPRIFSSPMAARMQTSQERLLRLLEYLKSDPDNNKLLADAMSLAAECGDLKTGLLLIERLEAMDVRTPELCGMATYFLLNAMEYEKASNFGDYAISKGVCDDVVLFNTAYAKFYDGAYQAACELLNLLTQKENCPISALLLHVRALDHLELNEDAEPLAQRAADLEPENSEAIGLLALQKYENGDNAAALKAAIEALTLNPSQLEALIACASSHYESGNNDAARKTWMHAIELYPECGRAWSGLGQIDFSELRFDEALDSLRRAVRYMPDHIGTWHVMAWIYILRDNISLAREALRSSHALDRNFGETYGAIAVCDAKEGKFDEARKNIRLALRLNPDSKSAGYAQVLILQSEGEALKADALISEILERNSPGGTESGRALMDRWLLNHNTFSRILRKDHH